MRPSALQLQRQKPRLLQQSRPQQLNWAPLPLRQERRLLRLLRLLQNALRVPMRSGNEQLAAGFQVLMILSVYVAVDLTCWIW